MSDTPRNKATQVGHLGRAPRKFLGAVNTPVFRATTMLFPTVADLEAAVRGEVGTIPGAPARFHRGGRPRDGAPREGPPPARRLAQPHSLAERDEVTLNR